MSHQLPPTKVKHLPPAFRRSVKHDPHGDTVLAQISPAEAHLLLDRGGAGVPNRKFPELTHFYVNSGGPNGSMQGGVGSNSTAGSHGGNTGGGKSSGSGNNSKAGPALTADQVKTMVTGSPLPMTTTVSGPAPTFTHNQGVQGPRPGTADRWGVTVGQDPEIQKQQNLYNSAADDYQNRGFGGWLRDNALDLIPGFHQKVPQWDVPSTYAGGIYHDAWSPLSAALNVAASAAPLPLTGAIAGRVGQMATDGLGLPDYTFGGGGWHPDETNAIETAYGKPQTPYGAPDPRASPTLGNQSRGTTGLLPQIAGNGGGVTPASLPVQTGSSLPPIVAPRQQNTNLGGYLSVPGPSSYGVLLPSWAY